MAKGFPLEFRNHEGLIWKSLLKWRDNKPRYLIVAGTINSGLQRGDRSIEDVCLHADHAYSILDVKEIHSIDKMTEYKYAVTNDILYICKIWEEYREVRVKLSKASSFDND